MGTSDMIRLLRGVRAEMFRFCRSLALVELWLLGLVGVLS